MDEASAIQEQEGDRHMIETKKNRSKKVMKKTLANIIKTKTSCCKKSPMILIMCPECHSTLRIEE